MTLRSPPVRFLTRAHAGRLLADRLVHFRARDPVVVAMPRGGVPVGYEIARALEAPLDVVIVRKLGSPGQPELAIGALVDGDRPEVVLNPEIVRATGADQVHLEREIERQLQLARAREERYRRGRAAVPIEGRPAILVDDGMATGATARAAVRGLRRRGPGSIVLAVPVAAPDALEVLRGEVDDVVCLHSPRTFSSVGAFYEDFGQTTDEEVVELLDASAARRAGLH